MHRLAVLVMMLCLPLTMGVKACAQHVRLHDYYHGRMQLDAVYYRQASITCPQAQPYDGFIIDLPYGSVPEWLTSDVPAYDAYAPITFSATNAWGFAGDITGMFHGIQGAFNGPTHPDSSLYYFDFTVFYNCDGINCQWTHVYPQAPLYQLNQYTVETGISGAINCSNKFFYVQLEPERPSTDQREVFIPSASKDVLDTCLWVGAPTCIQGGTTLVCDDPDDSCHGEALPNCCSVEPECLPPTPVLNLSGQGCCSCLPS